MMKTKRWLTGLLILLVTVVSIPLYGIKTQAAENLLEGDWQYSVNNDDETVTVTKYFGEGGSVAVPAIIAGKKVTGIGGQAFSGCTGLTDIVLPDGIRSIYSEAFLDCRSLTNITIPDSVSVIGDGAFENCSSLTDITIPNHVNGINVGTFTGCVSLTDITIPNNVTRIMHFAFENCNKLAHITIPDSITFIGSYAFKGCKRLAEITIPDSITAISQGAFEGCSNLVSIAIPANITKIYQYAFSGCCSLTDVYYASDKTNWQDIIVEIPNDYLAAANIHFDCTASGYDPLKYKVYTSKDTFSPFVYEGFDRPLEVCIKKTDYKPGIIYIGDNPNYNPQLAHMLIAMCNSVYNETSMKATFSSFGFKDSDSVTDHNMWDGIFIGYGMAKKELKNGKKLVLIVGRGTEENVEWISNLNAKVDIATGQHRGFSKAANGLYSKMINFLGTRDFSNTQFIITGFSRGAAVANILAGRLADNGVPQRDIYAYTFACPDVGLFSNEKVNSYECIFNIADAEDIVSWVPRTIIGNIWNKFGKSYWYSNIWNDYEGLEMCTDAHNQVAYLEYLRHEKDISTYKSRDGAKAALDDAANWRRTKFFSDVKKTILGFAGIHCPVNVEIYDSRGQLAGKITNNVIDYINDDKIHISIIDDQKDIYLLDNDAYTFNMTAIGDGTMEYVAQNIRVSDLSVVDSKTFLNVNLTEGKKMTSSIQSQNNLSEDTGIQTSKVRLLVLDDNGDAKTEVIADGNGTEIPVEDKIENPDNSGGATGDPEKNKPNLGNSGNQTKPTVKVEKITLTGISHKIAVGKKVTLQATVIPSNAADKSIVWKSSNTKYATVNSRGVVSIKKAGAGKTVTITATAGDGSRKAASYKIKCMKGIVKKVAISGQKNLSLKPGKSIKLKAKITASKGANKTLQWTSSNPKYATVTSKGKVTAKKSGKGKTVKITAMAMDGSGKKASVKIRIK